MTQEQATTALERIESARIVPAGSDASFVNWLDVDRFNHVQRIAKIFADSNLVPQQYRGKVADCIIAAQMAFRLQVDPFMFMQNTYVVYGRPGMEAKLAIALVNERGPFDGPIQWRFSRLCDGCGGSGTKDGRKCAKCEGTGSVGVTTIPPAAAMPDDLSCTAYATHRKTGAVGEARVSWKTVKNEGWLKKDGSKWLTMPEMMFRYRSAMFLARLFCPEALMGMQTTDELEDVGPRTITVEPARPPAADPDAFTVKPGSGNGNGNGNGNANGNGHDNADNGNGHSALNEAAKAPQGANAEASNSSPAGEPATPSNASECEEDRQPAADRSDTEAPRRRKRPAEAEPAPSGAAPVQAAQKVKLYTSQKPPQTWCEELTAAGFRHSATGTTWIAPCSEEAQSLAQAASEEPWCVETRCE